MSKAETALIAASNMRINEESTLEIAEKYLEWLNRKSDIRFTCEPGYDDLRPAPRIQVQDS